MRQIILFLFLIMFITNVEASEIQDNWEAINVEATAYTRYDEGCGDYTATGKLVTRGIISVDPDVIPLGTKVYIPGYGYAVADDTGGAISGYKIDIAMESVDEALEFGRRDIVIYIVK